MIKNMKTSSTLITLILILGISTSLFAEKEKDPVIAVVLAGGGALGFAHVGALQVLEEEGIRPDYVIGASMGSIIGGLYCLGYTPLELEQIIRDTDWKETLLDSVDRRELSFSRKKHQSNYRLSVGLGRKENLDDAGFSQGQHVMELLDSLISPRIAETDFDDLPISFRAVGADLLTGEKVVYDEGDLKTAIRASMAVPSVFTPVKYRGRYVIDGGWVENLPTTVARELGADIVIAVSLFSMTDEVEKLSTLAGLTNQADQIKTLDRNKASAEAADLIISPDLTGYSMADFEQGIPLMALGYEAASAMRQDIRTLAESIGPRSHPLERETGDPVIDIRWISVEEVSDSETIKEIKATLEEEMGYTPRSSELREQIYKLYDGGEYTHVWYRLLPTSDGRYDLIVDAPVRRKSKDNMSASLNFNSYVNESSLGDIQLKVAYQNWFGREMNDFTFVELWASEYPSLTAGIGHTPGWGEGMIALRGGVIQTSQYFYADDSLDSQYVLGKLGGSLFYEQALFKRFELSLGGYGRYNWTDRKMGTRNYPEEEWGRYGSKAMINIDTLDEGISPNRGLKALVVADFSSDDSGELSAVSKNAGELFIPVIPNGGGSLIFRGEFQSVIFGDIKTMELPALGTAFPVYGYYPQELKAENIALAGIGLRIRIASLPYTLGNDIYLQLAGNSATLWFDEQLDRYSDYDFFHGGALSFLMNTHLGMLEAGFNLNRDARWTLFIGLSTSTSFYDDIYY